MGGAVLVRGIPGCAMGIGGRPCIPGIPGIPPGIPPCIPGGPGRYCGAALRGSTGSGVSA